MSVLLVSIVALRGTASSDPIDAYSVWDMTSTPWLLSPHLSRFLSGIKKALQAVWIIHDPTDA